jgi:hypothetical protein
VQGKAADYHSSTTDYCASGAPGFQDKDGATKVTAFHRGTEGSINVGIPMTEELMAWLNAPFTATWKITERTPSKTTLATHIETIAKAVSDQNNHLPRLVQTETRKIESLLNDQLKTALKDMESLTTKLGSELSAFVTEARSKEAEQKAAKSKVKPAKPLPGIKNDRAALKGGNKKSKTAQEISGPVFSEDQERQLQNLLKKKQASVTSSSSVAPPGASSSPT